jgi:DNA-binding NtrC family response regulator
MNRFARKHGAKVGGISPACLAALQAHSWPGNVRELQNVIERAVILASDGQIRLDRVMCGFAGSTPSPEEPAQTTKGTRIFTALEMERLERANIVRALDASGWTVSGEKGAARLLGIPPTTLSSRMKALKIRRLASTDSE